MLLGPSSGLPLVVLCELPHIEIDALFHGPDWTPRESFTADVDAFSAQPHWVTEWQYSQVREVLVERADLMVWLDLPRRAVMRRIIARTLRRRLRREVLWNGNNRAGLVDGLHRPGAHRALGLDHARQGRPRRCPGPVTEPRRHPPASGEV